MKHIADQIAAMEHLWPEFVLRARDDRSAVWEGELMPYKTAYLVRLSFTTPILGTQFTLREIQPRLRVLSPRLEQHADYDEGPLPHVYWDSNDPAHPVLCLFSIEGKEWSLDDLIAETTVFWAAQWLNFYEGWLVTKTWQGGGRHPQVPKGTKQLAAI